jgi:hypothetical protein
MYLLPTLSTLVNGEALRLEDGISKDLRNDFCTTPYILWCNTEPVFKD